MRAAGVLCLVLVLTSFSGCVSELLGGAPSASAAQITKQVLLTFNSDSMRNEEPRIEDLVKTSLEYTHRGADVATSAVTADYLGASGSPRSQTLTLFTTKTSLHDGDVVTVTGANLTSGLVVREGSKVLAERKGVEVSWLRVDGGPIGVASSKDGEVRYSLSSTGGFDAAAADFTQGDTHFAKVAAKLDGSVAGSMVLKTIAAAAGPRLEASLDLTPKLSADASLTAEDSHGAMEAGVKTTDLQGRVEALGVLQFDHALELQRTGGSGHVFFDGRVHEWDRDHPKSSNYEPSEIKHPMVDESHAYQEEAFSHSDPMPAAIVDVFTRLWAAPVAVGDDYRVHSDYHVAGGGFQFDIVLQIVAEETRTAGGHAMPSYRISQLANLVLQPPGSAETSFDLIHGTYWIAQASHLPVYGQVSYAKSFDRADIERLLKTLGSDAPVTLPATATLTVRGEQTMKLEAYSGDLQVAPILGVIMSNSLGLSEWSPGAMFGSMGRFMGGSEHPAMPVAPDIAFVDDDANGRMHVATVSSNAPWRDIQIRSASGPAVLWVRLNGEADSEATPVYRFDSELPADQFPNDVQGSDFLDFCRGSDEGAVQITLTHGPTNTVLHTYTFSGLPACA